MTHTERFQIVEDWLIELRHQIKGAVIPNDPSVQALDRDVLSLIRSARLMKLQGGDVPIEKVMDLLQRLQALKGRVEEYL